MGKRLMEEYERDTSKSKLGMTVNAVMAKKQAVPRYEHDGDACMDLRVTEGALVKAGATVKFWSGLSMQIPYGYVGLVFSRSGMSSNRGLVLANGVGVIDSTYRGEIGLPIRNVTDEDVYIEEGERVAQIGLFKFEPFAFNFVERLDESERGTGGFGSTGSA